MADSYRKRTVVEYQLVEGKPGHSFRIRGPNGKVIPGMETPMWFETQAAAKSCAEQMIRSVLNTLRQMGGVIHKG